MKKQSTILRAITVSLVFVISLSCTSLSPQSLTATPGPGGVSGSSGGVSGSSGGNGSGDGGSGNGNGGSGNGNGGGDNNEGNLPSEGTPALTPDITLGSYIVKQTVTLGGETISGLVCSVNDPFSITNASPKVTFTIGFTPKSANNGALAYAYSIQSAGESHTATGTYTLSSPERDGTIHLSMSVSDHVVFKGFDGNLPVRYKFDLVPSMSTTCPGN